MHSGETIILRVSDLSRGGAAVARDEEGCVYFIPRAAPGDVVQVRVVKRKKKYAETQLLKVIEPSGIRQIPKCKVFEKCGGCEWQHIPYSLQWETKSRGIKQALSRVQIEIPAGLEEFPAEQIWSYRNRIQLRGWKDCIGFFEVGSHQTVPIERCETAMEEINANLQQVRQSGSSLARTYKVEMEVLPDREIRVTWNSRHGEHGFRQIHDEQNEKLRAWIQSCLSEGRIVFDLFGGDGNLSREMAGKMVEVHCVDLSVPETRKAGLPDNFYYHQAGVLPWLLKRVENQEFDQKASVLPASVILDPPRAGIGDALAEIDGALKKLFVSQLICVGCEADAWARDLSRFLKRGWMLKRVGIFDFFPQTHHVESAAFLEL